MKTKCKAIDIAKYIVGYAEENGTPIVTTGRVHKLLYYAQAWYLVNCGEPLFNEKIKAQLFGPVISGLQEELASSQRNLIDFDKLECAKDIKDIEIISYLDSFCKEFIKYSATDLLSMIHNEKPWEEAFYSDKNDKEIKPEVMKKFYEDFLNCTEKESL